MLLTLLKFSTAAWAVVSLPTPAKGPKYECRDSERNVYKIWIGREDNRLQATDPAGRVRAIKLSGANVARPEVYEGQTLRYNGWNMRGRDIYAMLDASTEFAVQYVVLNDSTRVRVSLVLDNRERAGLVCTLTGISANVVALEKDVSLPERYADLFAEVTSLRQREGTLKPIAILRIEAILRRMMLIPEFKKGPDRTKFLELAAPFIKNIDSRTTVQISARQKGPVAAYWKQLLDDIRYKYHSDSTRFGNWVKEGARPEAKDIASVIAGFNAFVASPAFRDQSLRDLFVADVTESMKLLDETDLLNAKTYLTNEGRKFFEPLWVKVNGRKTLVDYPQLESATRALVANLRAKEFDAFKVYKAFSYALKVQAPMDAEAKALFHKAISPLLKLLDARSREDMLGWLENPAERNAFDDLIR